MIRIKFDLNPKQVALMDEALNELMWTYGTVHKGKVNEKLCREADDLIRQFRKATAKARKEKP